MFRLFQEHKKVMYLFVTHDFLYVQVHEAFEQNLKVIKNSENYTCTSLLKIPTLLVLIKN